MRAFLHRYRQSFVMGAVFLGVGVLTLALRGCPSKDVVSERYTIGPPEAPTETRLRSPGEAP